MTQNTEVKVTPEDVWKILAEITEKHKELTEKHKELTEKHKETEMALKELTNSQKNMNDNLGGIGRSNGAVAEEWFFTELEVSKKVGELHFDFIARNLKQEKLLEKPIKGEYDIVLINSNTIIVIQVKYKVKTYYVDRLYHKELPIFLKLFPHYSNYTIYGGIAGLSFEDGSKEQAKKYGFFVLGQGEKHIKVDSLDVKPFRKSNGNKTKRFSKA